MEHVVISIVSMAGATIVTTAIATSFLLTRISERLPRTDYEKNHNALDEKVTHLFTDLERRVRDLEMFRARHNGDERKR